MMMKSDLRVAYAIFECHPTVGLGLPERAHQLQMEERIS